MKTLKHLPSLAFFVASLALLIRFFRYSITSFDLRPWLITFLCASWVCSFLLGRMVASKFPERIRGILIGVIATTLGAAIYLAAGWPLAELVTSQLREMRGYQSELGTTYFYHDFSGSGTGNLFDFYSQTFLIAVVMTGISFLVALLACPILGIPYILSKYNQGAQVQERSATE